MAFSNEFCDVCSSSSSETIRNLKCRHYANICFNCNEGFNRKDMGCPTCHQMLVTAPACPDIPVFKGLLRSIFFLKKKLQQAKLPQHVYFRMSINRILSERIIIQLDQAKAPLMCAKFVEMCTIEKGYKGSKIFKVCKDEMVMLGSGWCHTYSPHIRTDFFNIDRSEIVERRGSLRFRIKKSENKIAEASTNFNVVLLNRPPHHKVTSVFAQVIEGLYIFDEISRLCPKCNCIKMADCGIC